MKKIFTVIIFGLALTAAGCSVDNPDNESKTVTLLAYDSFVTSDGIFDDFTKDTGINVEVITGGDAAQLLAKAAVTAGNPEADVLWGIDNTLIARAIDDEIFQPYESPLLSQLNSDATTLVPNFEATPVDTGDVCINIDTNWFAKNSLAAPEFLTDLISPKYKNLTVVPSPVTSSPGLAFMLATIADFGDEWTQYWTSLLNNGAKVVDGWTQAYTVEFSGSTGQGDYPIVVSYGTSPPAEVLFSDPPIDSPDTAVLANTCFHQIEFAGILRGTKNLENAEKLIDYLIGEKFQADISLNMFVYPVNSNVPLPDLFSKFAVRPTKPYVIAPEVIADKQTEWLDMWIDIAGQ